MTINKAQGQTVQNVGVYLSEPVFAYEQLYVVLSRGTNKITQKHCFSLLKIIACNVLIQEMLSIKSYLKSSKRGIMLRNINTFTTNLHFFCIIHLITSHYIATQWQLNNERATYYKLLDHACIICSLDLFIEDIEHCQNIKEHIFSKLSLLIKM